MIYPATYLRILKQGAKAKPGRERFDPSRWITLKPLAKRGFLVKNMYQTEQEPQPITAEELQNLLQRPETDDLIAEALSRTNTRGMKFAGRLLGQEHGFVAYGDLSESQRLVELSQLMEGQEGSVDIYDQLRLYFLRRNETPKPHIFDFHTHTHLWLRLSKELWKDPEAIEKDDREVNLFSRTDLKNEPSMLGLNPYLISALGTEENGIGKILLSSWRDPASLPRYDHLTVYSKSRLYLVSSLDPLDAYREAGFNAAHVRVDLSRKPILDVTDIKNASRMLTQDWF